MHTENDAKRSQSMEEMMKKQLFATRAAVVLLACILAVVLLFAVSMRIQMTAALDGVDLPALAEKLSELDMQQVNATLAQIEQTAGALDVEEFNQALAELREAAANLNDAAEAVRGFAGLFGAR